MPIFIEVKPNRFMRKAGEPGDDLTQREMSKVMMKKLGTGLHVNYSFDLSRQDLKVVHEALTSGRYN